MYVYLVEVSSVIRMGKKLEHGPHTCWSTARCWLPSYGLSREARLHRRSHAQPNLTWKMGWVFNSYTSSISHYRSLVSLNASSHRTYPHVPSPGCISHSFLSQNAKSRTINQQSRSLLSHLRAHEPRNSQVKICNKSIATLEYPSIAVVGLQAVVVEAQA